MGCRIGSRLVVSALAAAAVVAVCASSATADTSDPGHAIILQVIEPGASSIVDGEITSGSTGGGGLQAPADGSAVTTGSWSESVQPGSSQASGAAGSLLGGAVTYSSLHAAASTSGGAHTSAYVSGLTLFGQAVAGGAGDSYPLSNWGSLSVGAGVPLSSGQAGIAALVVNVTQAYNGVPAGSVIVIGSVTASAPPPSTGGGTPPPHHRKPASGGSGSTGRSGSGSGSQSSGGSTGSSWTVSHSSSKRHSHKGAAKLKHRKLSTHPRTLPRQARARIVAWAASQIGWPYVWGGESEREGGFDCSGLVDFAYAKAGFRLPGRPTAEVLWQMSQPIAPKQLQPGDLVFLLDNTGYAYHVAMYAGNDMVIVASHTGAPVAREPFVAGQWQAFGRLWTHGKLRLAEAPHPAPQAVKAARELARPQPHPGHTPTAIPISAFGLAAFAEKVQLPDRDSGKRRKSRPPATPPVVEPNRPAILAPRSQYIAGP